MQNENLLNGFGTLKAIFFDMDGVIYDSMGNHSVAWSKAFAHLGWDFPLEQVYLNEGRTGSSTIHLPSIPEFLPTKYCGSRVRMWWLKILSKWES